MLSAFLTVRFVALDLGGQSVKVAESSFSGLPQIRPNPSGSISTPSAISFNTNRTLGPDEDAAIINSLDVKFGESAFRYLKRRPNNGYQYLGSVIGRSNSSIENTAPLLPSEMLSIYLHQICQPFLDNQVSLVVPYYWTKLQRSLARYAAQLGNVGVNHLIDDTMAMATLYGSTRSARFLNKSHTVIFIDFGAFKAEVYGQTFVLKSNYTVVEDTWKEWTEEVGCLRLEKEVAKAMNVSRKAAQRLLNNEALTASLPAVASLVKEFTYKFARVVSITKQMIGPDGEIDEVQLIGGGSRYKFLQDIIKREVNCSILRDFNAQEALAIGGVLVDEIEDGFSSYQTLYHSQSASASSKLKCAETHGYCTKGASCRDQVVEEASEGCDVIEVFVDEEDVPKGTNTIQSTYKMQNFTKSPGKFLHFKTHKNINAVLGVELCDQNKTECIPVEISSLQNEKAGDDSFYMFNTIGKIIEAIDEKRMKVSVISKIAEYLEYLKMAIADPNIPLQDGINPLDQEQIETVTRIAALYDEDGFANLTLKEVTQHKETLDHVLKSMVATRKQTEEEL